MFWIKKVLKWLGLGLLFAMLLVVAVPWFPVISDSFAADTQKDYLAENNQMLDLTQVGGNFAFDNDFYEKRLFMLGEMHGYSRVQVLDLVLLTHLNAELGVRYYMAEFDPAVAIIFNHFLRTGDDEAFKAVFDIWHDERQSQWGNLEFIEKVRAIRDLNATLPNAHKIRFIGVDGPPKDKFIELAQALTGLPEEPVHDVNQILLEASDSREESTGRYSHILSNISLMHEALPGAKFYGLWGISHVNKVGVNKAPSLSTYLNEGTEKILPLFKDDVATITTYCVGACTNMMVSGILPGVPKPENGEPYTEIPMNFDSTYMFRIRGIGATKEIMSAAPNMLFDVNNAGSPYFEGSALVASSGYMSMLRDFHIDGAAAENFDAVIIMKGSGPLTPVKGKSFVFMK